jgi:uncharacterized protein
MSPRGRRITLLLAVVVGVLFAGRWLSSFLSDLWWSRAISAPAAALVLQWHLRQLALEGTGVLIASVWCIGNLAVFGRVIRSLEVPRRLGNIEIREALSTGDIQRLLVVVGLVAGLLVGQGLSAATSTVVLAFAGVVYGTTDPILGQDLGVYVAQVPLWRLAHLEAVLLVCLAIGGMAMLYTLVGGIQWEQGRPSLADAARRHLGILVSLLALVLAWGYQLEPYEMVAGLNGAGADGLYRLHREISLVLFGVAAATTLLSLAWAWRPRPSLAMAGWAVLAFASLIGHFIVPALASGRADRDPLSESARRELDGLAYGLGAIHDSMLVPANRDPTSWPTGVWDSAAVLRAVGGESSPVAGLGLGLVPVAGQARPAWLAVRVPKGQPAELVAIADDRTSALGGPVSYAASDTFAYPRAVARLTLSRTASYPGAPAVVTDTGAPGPAAGGLGRRLLMAWGLQAGSLLAPQAPGTRVASRLDPVERVSALAPFIEWGDAHPRLVGGELTWVIPGALVTQSFPLSTRLTWREQRVGGLRTDFLALVTAEGAETRLFLRHSADPLAETWARLAQGMIEPASAIPAELSRDLDYPREQLRVQARVLERAHWHRGRAVGHVDTLPEEIPVPELHWRAGSDRAAVVAFTDPASGRITSLLEGVVADGWDRVALYSVDSAAALDGRQELEQRWARSLPLVDLRDSVRQGGGTWRSGPIRFFRTGGALGASRATYAVSPNGELALIWFDLAVDRRTGGGRNLTEALRSLLGQPPQGVPVLTLPVQLDEARRWYAIADSALRRGDFATFGRAFEALRRILGVQAGSHK